MRDIRGLAQSRMGHSTHASGSPLISKFRERTRIIVTKQ
jgi:hypothetical protein